MRRRIWIGSMISATAIAAIVIAASAGGQERGSAPSKKAPSGGASTPSYTGDLFEATESNTDFRRVLFTGQRSQLVVMSIPPGESIGAEKHPHVEQTLVILSGSGRTELDGKKSKVGRGDVIVVTPGTQHNLINTGKRPLKLFTIYSPPNHLPGRVHKTKADAERDVEDQQFGRQVE